MDYFCSYLGLCSLISSPQREMANYSGAAGAFRKLTDMTMKTRPLNSARGSHACTLWAHFVSYFNTLTLTPLRLSNLLSEGIWIYLTTPMNFLNHLKSKNSNHLQWRQFIISMHNLVKTGQKNRKEIGSNLQKGNQQIHRALTLANDWLCNLYYYTLVVLCSVLRYCLTLTSRLLRSNRYFGSADFNLEFLPQPQRW